MTVVEISGIFPWPIFKTVYRVSMVIRVIDSSVLTAPA